MARRVAALALLLTLSGTVGALPAAAAAPLQGDERSRAIEGLRAGQREVQTLRAAVVQRKRHPLLKAEAVTRGVLWFRRPHLVRWEVAAPERTVVVIDDESLVVYRPDRREAERRGLRDDLATRAAVEFLAAGMSLDLAEMERRFQVDLYRGEGQLTLVLTPRSRWVAQAIASVTIVHREGEAVPRQIAVVGRQGDSTETSLADVVVNPPIAPETFALRLGPEVRVVETRQAPQDTPSGR